MTNQTSGAGSACADWLGYNAGMVYLSGRESDQPARASELEELRALLVLAQGFEDAEAVCALDMLGWTKYRPSVATVSVEIAGLRERVTGAFGTSFVVDALIDDVEPARYDGLVIPGGFHNLGYDEIYDERARDLARRMRRRGCPIATMCVGILPVAEAGLLNGGRATTYSFSSRHDNRGRLAELGCTPVDEPVVDCNGIISCSGPAYSEQVMQLFLEKLVGPDAAAEVAHYRRGIDS